MSSNILDEFQKKLPILVKNSSHMCFECKAVKLLCGQPTCPLLASLDIQKHVKPVPKELFGESPQVFIGSHNYPFLKGGPLIAHENINTELASNPRKWFEYPLEDILSFRYALVRANQMVNARIPTSLTEPVKEIALSMKAIDVEASFSKPPNPNARLLDTILQPMGPSGELEKLRIVENPIIPRKVDSVLEESLPSVIQMRELFQKGFDVYYIQQVLSTGLLGVTEKQSLVPTRWSITATDDALGKILIKKILEYPLINDYEVYENSFLDNHFHIILAPFPWFFEQFESWQSKTIFTLTQEGWQIIKDNEGFQRNDRAGKRYKYSKQAGGYYASRFSVVEHLNNRHRQAGALVIREIGSGYIVPVGVSQVRENVRQALANPPVKFHSLHDVLSYLKTRLKVPLKTYVAQSDFLGQARLTDFFQ